MEELGLSSDEITKLTELCIDLKFREPKLTAKSFLKLVEVAINLGLIITEEITTDDVYNIIKEFIDSKPTQGRLSYIKHKRKFLDNNIKSKQKDPEKYKEYMRNYMRKNYISVKNVSLRK